MNDKLNERILTKAEKFAKEIVDLAANEGLTVSEFREAAYIAKKVANESSVTRMGIERYFE